MSSIWHHHLHTLYIHYIFRKKPILVVHYIPAISMYYQKLHVSYTIYLFIRPTEQNQMQSYTLTRGIRYKPWLMCVYIYVYIHTYNYEKIIAGALAAAWVVYQATTVGSKIPQGAWIVVDSHGGPRITPCFWAVLSYQVAFSWVSLALDKGFGTASRHAFRCLCVGVASLAVVAVLANNHITIIFCSIWGVLLCILLVFGCYFCL